MSKSTDLYKKAKEIIPGGTQLLSKRPEMFLPEMWPAYYRKAKGCKVWDLDGIEYTDMSYMGIGANVLGYADDDVNNAAMEAIERSSMCTLNAPEEVELGELLIELHPWAKMVRYSKSGAEAMAIAVRIARAYTKKDIILFCGYHGWSDWYLAANLAENSALDGHLLKGLNPNGVPRGLKGTSIPFVYNDIDGFKSQIEKFKGQIAAVVMEPIRSAYPVKGFLETIRDITKTEGIVLVIDEITSGFRLNCGGAHLTFGIKPDIAVFGKAISNGFPMAAILGKEGCMQATQDSFISSTYWTDRVGLAASIACIRKYRDEKVHFHLNKVGEEVQKGWKYAAETAGLSVRISGIYPLSHFEFLHDEPLVYKTVFIQEMLKRGYLATNSLYASYAHSEKHLMEYQKEVESVFSYISENQGSLRNLIEYEVCHSGFQRLT